VEQPQPPLVLASHAVEFEVMVPTQGERRVWLEMAAKNAQLALQQRVREKSAQEGRLAALREALHLPETVQRIECFDVSHTMGEATVASCVVYDRHAMQRGEYRRFNVRDATPGDDYAAMRQVLSRRYERVNAQGGKVPDLVLVDGGKGQVRAARAALVELGMNDVSVLGVAKGPERKAGLEELIVESEDIALSLPPTHLGLHLVQQIRDEAHRFAIVGHRARRAKTRTASALTQIPGIGAQRRQRLLAHFGGLREVQAAAVDELMRVAGISRPLAERIYKALH
jgi:excinuclease ABC subunit C